jgi:PadR family transcriptional regulator PadR
MPPQKNELLHGTLETLILRTLVQGPMHGYAIARWLEQASDDVLQIEDGSLYPALYRMEQRGWVSAAWGTSDGGRRAKFYGLTPVGRRRLAVSTNEWARFASAVSRVLLPA